MTKQFCMDANVVSSKISVEQSKRKNKFLPGFIDVHK